MQRDLGTLSANPNAKATDYSSLIVKYPQLSEQLKRSWDVVSADRKEGVLKNASNVYAALQSGRNDVALTLLGEQAKALRNSGMEQDAKASETIAKLVEMSPETAKTSVALMLASTLGPDKFADTIR